MENIFNTFGEIVPWLVIICLCFFSFLNISYIYGLFKAKKTDPTLKLSLNTLGKVVFSLLYGGYILLILYTITAEINIFTNAALTPDQKYTAALNAPNLLTIFTLLACFEFQDIFFIGNKNILIGNRMFDIRRMRKVGYPKKHQIAFTYGQKLYTYSTRFADMMALKGKFSGKYK